MDTSWPNLVFEIGYGFTGTVKDCKNYLLNLGGSDITHKDVAEIISLMCRTHTNLTDSNTNLPSPGTFWPGIQIQHEYFTWKPEVFVQALKEIQPTLSWEEVCLSLDHAEFIITDRKAFTILINTIRLGMQSSGTGQDFPIEYVYRCWVNLEGQLSLITAILYNADIYSFADHILRRVFTNLLNAPEAYKKEIESWKSLDLIDALLYIADNNFYTEVSDVFKLAEQQCPDILFMGLLQVLPPISHLRHDMLQRMVPIFLENHPSCGAILDHAWNSTNFGDHLRLLIMDSMIMWYEKGGSDQSRLSRILDLAHDLDALSSLLNMNSFMFVIDLACLASCHEYLNLELWISDKIREHGGSFMKEIVQFLYYRCPELVNKKLPDGVRTTQLSHDTLTTIMSCLLSSINSVHPGYAEVIKCMAARFTMIQKPPPSPSVVKGGHSLGLPKLPQHESELAAMVPTSAPSNISVSVPSTDDRMGGVPEASGNVVETPYVMEEIEDEANRYFYRLFNDPPHPSMPVEEALDMLQQFQESPNEREREVSRCILRILFEKYRLIEEYPERHLQLAAEFFGGLLGRNLLTGDDVEIILRCVWIALILPVGSNMFMFGITALDCFKDRLHVYPRFCEEVILIPSFSEFSPHLIECVERVVNAQEPVNNPPDGDIEEEDDDDEPTIDGNFLISRRWG